MTQWDDYLKAHRWGVDNCIQDAFENAPFASVGGLDARQGKLRAPKYVPPHLAVSYLAGYVEQAKGMYGPDWQTCKFGWYPAIEIRDENADLLKVKNEQSTKEDSGE